MKIKLPIYKFEKNSLVYENINLSLKNIIYFLVSQLMLSVLFLFLITFFFNTPKELKLKRELNELKLEFQIIENKTNDILFLFELLEEKDSVIYQSIFSAKDTTHLFKNYYIPEYDGDYIDTLIRVGEKLSLMKTKMESTNNYFRALLFEVGSNNDRLNHMPAIQPISNEDLRRVSSGFGFRYHPIYNIRKFHYGIDFVAPEGTSIYATADGVISIASNSYHGYGTYIKINHGYDYATAYGHLHELKVKSGSNVKRGDIIGTVGNTGMSTGNHLHYEVHYKNEYVNPINYFQDLTPTQYKEMIRISNSIEKSMD